MNSNFFRLTLLALLAVATLGLAACGDDDSDSADVGDLGPDPATMAPADAPFYGETVVRPDGEMRENFEETLATLGFDDVGGMITSELDAELSEDGITYAADIEPWLGARVGGFLTDFDAATEKGEGAVAIAVTDADAAQAFIDKAAESGSTPLEDATYNDVDYKTDGEASIGISGDFLVAGTQQGFEDAVDAGAGDSLADNTEANETRDEVPEDALFQFYVDTQSVIDLVESSGELTGEQLRQFEAQVAQYAEGSVDFWGTVGDDTFDFAFSAPAVTDAPEPSELVAGFPSDAWFAFAAADVGEQIQLGLEQFQQGFEAGFESTAPPGFEAPTIDPLQEIEDATGLNVKKDFAWIGDIGGYVQGTDLLRGALAKDPTLNVTPTDSGFEIAIPPTRAEVAVADGNFVATAGAATTEDALDPDESLDESDRFNAARDALGEDVVPAFYLDFLPLLQLIESAPEATSDPEFQAAKPYLDALDFFVAGSKLDGDRTTGSVVLGVREADDSEETSATIVP